MKAKALAVGFDGTKSYKPGDTLEGESDHIRELLFNGIAEPLDDAAKEVCAMAEKLPEDQRKINKLYRPELAEGVATEISESVKVAKTKK